MAEITVEKLRYYYDKAQIAKEGVTEKYNEVLNYTDVSYQISEDKSKILVKRMIQGYEVVHDSEYHGFRTIIIKEVQNVSSKESS